MWHETTLASRIDPRPSRRPILQPRSALRELSEREWTQRLLPFRGLCPLPTLSCLGLAPVPVLVLDSVPARPLALCWSLSRFELGALVRIPWGLPP